MKECGHNVRLPRLPSFFYFQNQGGGKPKSFEVNWGLATTSTNSHHWFFGRWSMPKSLHHPWSRPHPLLHFLLACLGVEVKDLFYFDPYVTSVRLSFSPRYFGGYYSPKREKNYLEKWDPLHVTTRKMTLDLKQREPSFSSDGKGSVKSSRWDEWAQRAKIAPKML